MQGLRLNDLGNLFRGGMPSVDQIGKALALVQLGPNNFAAPSGGSLSGANAPGPTTTLANAPTVANTQSPSIPGTTSFTIPGIGAAGVGGAFASAFATGIQNTLNDVRIQSRTQIDASIAAFNTLRSNFGSSLLRDNLVGSGAR